MIGLPSSKSARIIPRKSVPTQPPAGIRGDKINSYREMRNPPTSYVGPRLLASPSLTSERAENILPSRRSIVQIRKREFESREAASNFHGDRQRTSAFTEDLGDASKPFSYVDAQVTSTSPTSHESANHESTFSDYGRSPLRPTLAKVQRPRLISLYKSKAKQQSSKIIEDPDQAVLKTLLKTEDDFQLALHRVDGQKILEPMPPAYWSGRLMGILDRYMNDQLEQSVAKKSSPSRFGFLGGTGIEEQNMVKEEEIRRTKLALEMVWESCGSQEARDSFRVSEMMTQCDKCELG